MPMTYVCYLFVSLYRCAYVTCYYLKSIYLSKNLSCLARIRPWGSMYTFFPPFLQLAEEKKHVYSRIQVVNLFIILWFSMSLLNFIVHFCLFKRMHSLRKSDFETKSPHAYRAFFIWKMICTA
jgi:hypothetical protein